MIKVKVCGMRDRLNIQAIAAVGPDYLGFIFYQGSKRYVGINPDKVLFSEIPAGIKKVGVFVNEKPEIVLALANQYDLNLVQLHGDETAAYCRAIVSAGLSIIKAFGIGPGFNFESLVPYLPVCDYFLFDAQSGQHGGSGLQFNWQTLNLYQLEVPFFLSGGISYEDARAIRSLCHPALYAVDINSKFETAPGFKDIDKVKTFIQEIKSIKP
jgi:phosphoribosylanthranilate isomerase